MAKKDVKSKAAEKKARVAAKQSKKAVQKEKKGKSKPADDSDADDVDIETVLEEYAKQVRLWEELTSVSGKHFLKLYDALADGVGEVLDWSLRGLVTSLVILPSKTCAPLDYRRSWADF